MRSIESLTFDNSYARLPDGFHSRLTPTPLAGAHLVAFNAAAAGLIGLDPREAGRPDFVEYLTGVRPLPGAEPLAMLYAGHQFGHWVPQLGDGRAILLGEARGPDGRRWDLHLKGAGPTPYSRDGDGRAVLRSSVREYLCSEAMHGLGIPTSRALCLIGSTEEVYREQIERGAMLVRLAPSHVRFGSFEVFYHRGQFEQLRALADYVLAEQFPELGDDPAPYAALLREVVQRTARLIAQWQLVGFAHGVMNTDNMSVLGLTLDYGPFGFLDAYDPGFVCNHSDRWGRYAFDKQPEIGLWNLSCFAQALLPLLDPDDGEAAAAEARDILAGYQPELVRSYAQGMRAKLGLRSEAPGDRELAAALLRRMQHDRVDYTNAFRALSRLRRDDRDADGALRNWFADPAAFDSWAADYRARLRAEGSDDAERQARMERTNPRYVLRNYLAQRAIERAEAGDPSEIERLCQVLARPYDEQPEHAAYAAPPPAWGRELVVSCSS
jgi:uncharacterized protein YdiU (UPF0061 family)